MSPTPILDRRQGVVSPKRRRWAPLIVGGVIGGVAAPFIPSDAVDRVLQSPVRLLLFSWAAFYLAILIHELGHLVMAAIQGFQFRQISVAPLSSPASRVASNSASFPAAFLRAAT